MSAADRETAISPPTRRNPASERRHPPGRPDPDWCRGNGCWWDCQRQYEPFGREISGDAA